MSKPVSKVDDVPVSKIVMHKPMESDKRHRSMYIQLFTAAGKDYQTEYYWSTGKPIEKGVLPGAGWDFFPRPYKTVASAITAAVKQGWSITV